MSLALKSRSGFRIDGDERVRTDLARVVNVLVVALIVLGIGLRLWFLASPLGALDADEAVVGLMGDHALSGTLRAFYLGQDYGSTHEALVVAVLLLLRVPRVLAAKLGITVLFAVASTLVWRIGRRMVPDRPGLEGELAGRLAGALFWAAPAGIVWMSTKSRGFYGSGLVFGLAFCLLALRLDERWTARDAALAGLAVGSAWWATPQAGYLVLPAAAWLAARLVRSGRIRDALVSLPVIVGSAAVAALPWVVTNLGNGFRSLESPGGIPPTSYFDRFELFFRRGLPMAFGLRNPVSPEWILGRVGQALYVAIPLAALALLVWRRPRLGPLFLVTAGVAAYPLIFAVFPTSFSLHEARYVTLLGPFLALALAVALVRWGGAVAAAVAVACVAALSILGSAAAIDLGGTPGLWDVSAGDLDPLVATLDAEGIDRAFADYWIAHRLDYETDEDVIAAPLEYIRYAPYEEAVRKDPRPAYVLFRGTQQEQWLGAYLAREQIGFDRADAGIYVIYRPDAKVLPERVTEMWARARGFPDLVT